MFGHSFELPNVSSKHDSALRDSSAGGARSARVSLELGRSRAALPNRTRSSVNAPKQNSHFPNYDFKHFRPPRREVRRRKKNTRGKQLKKITTPITLSETTGENRDNLKKNKIKSTHEGNCKVYYTETAVF